MDQRELATKVAWAYIGTWYSWGGDSPDGFDCSGLVIEILKSADELSRRFDATADRLYGMFTEVEHPYEGCLACYLNSDGKCVHIEYCIDEHTTIGASGGYSATKTKEDAIKHNAFVKVRPINYRRGEVVFVDPFLLD